MFYKFVLELCYFVIEWSFLLQLIYDIILIIGNIYLVLLV